MQFDPFWLFRIPLQAPLQTPLHAPLSGNVGQDISAPWFSPTLTLNYAGDAAIESRIVHDVASYGKQLGWLNEVVLALAQEASLSGPARESLARMQAAAKHIDNIKADQRKDALATASAALERLRIAHPQAYEQLLQAHARARSMH